MKNSKDIDNYIKTAPKEARSRLRQMRAAIRKAAPQATEAMNYRIPTYRLNGNLVHFGAFKDHVSFFPTSSGVRAFKKELSKYHTAKGTIQFPPDKPLPLGLISKIVAFRVKENSRKGGKTCSRGHKYPGNGPCPVCWLGRVKTTEKKFVPKPGQIDFTNVRWVPVLNCVVAHEGKILLVQRNKGLRLYPGYWNGISGFLDDRKSLSQKIYEELREELGLSKKHILSITPAKILHQDAPRYKKTWIVHPVLIRVDTDKIKLDWEAQDYTWIRPGDAVKFDLLPGFAETLHEALKVSKIRTANK